MAIIVPDLGSGVDLSPARGSRITPADTYARPAIPGPADTSIGDALSLLGTKMNSVATDETNKEIERQKMNADLYASTVASSATAAGGAFTPDMVNRPEWKLHPQVAAYVSQQAGVINGRTAAQQILGEPPPEALASPEGAATWVQAKRAEALKASGNVPFYSAGYMQSVEAAANARIQGLDSFRQENVRNLTMTGMKSSVYNAMQTGGPNLSNSSNPQVAGDVYNWAQSHGYDPLWALAVMNFETGGKIHPDTPNGADPKRFGLIQFGQAEQQEFGVTRGMTLPQQLESVHNYLAARGFDPKKYGPDDASQARMRQDFYSTINSGSPGNPNAVDSGTTVAEKVARIEREHLPVAGRMLGLRWQSAPALQGATTYRGTPGRITDVNGQDDPANFKSLRPEAQAAAKQIAGAFGQPLIITPHGGTQADKRGDGSQHHDGRAVDISIASLPDSEKTRLVATAIANGANGVGAYSAGSGVGTVHIDFRQGGGNGPGGLALWHRQQPGVDSPYTTGPAWFQEGVRQGLAARGNGGSVAMQTPQAPYRVASAGNSIPIPGNGVPRPTVILAPSVVPPAVTPAPTDIRPQAQRAQDAPVVADDGSPLPPKRPAAEGDLTPEVLAAAEKKPAVVAPVVDTTVDPRSGMPLDVLRMHDEIIYQANVGRAAMKGGNWFLNQWAQDSAQMVINKATEKKDPRFLRAYPQEWMTADVEKQFDAARKQIEAQRKQDLQEAYTWQERGRKEDKRKAEQELVEKAIKKEKLSDEERLKYNKIDPDLVTEWAAKRDAVDKGQIDREDEFKKLDAVKQQQRVALARGGDPTDVPVSHILDPEVMKRAMANADELKKLGPEYGDSYYKRRWDQALLSYWGYAYNGAVNMRGDVNVPKIQSAFERYHQAALVEWMDGHNGKLPMNDLQKQEVFERALGAVQKEYPPNNDPAGARANNTDPAAVRAPGAATPAPAPAPAPTVPPAPRTPPPRKLNMFAD